jgi:hypothetical protein
VSIQQRFIGYAIGLVWITGNVWVSLPVHSGGLLTIVTAATILILNPIVFFALVWYGRKNESIVITFVCPAVVLVAWEFVPPFGAAHRWGWDAFFVFLFHIPGCSAHVYFAVCGVAYLLGVAVGRRAATQSPPVR